MHEYKTTIWHKILIKHALILLFTYLQVFFDIVNLIDQHKNLNILLNTQLLQMLILGTNYINIVNLKYNTDNILELFIYNHGTSCNRSSYDTTLNKGETRMCLFRSICRFWRLCSHIQNVQKSLKSHNLLDMLLLAKKTKDEF